MSSQSDQRANLSATVLLTLSAVGLWLGVLGTMFLVLGQLGVCERLKVPLQNTPTQVFSAARWFNSYWWVAGAALFVLMPLNWIWGAVLVLPPLLLLGVLARSLLGSQRAVLQHLQAQDANLDHLTPDGQLRSPLTVTETRRGGPRPGQEVLVIEPSGNWRIVNRHPDGREDPPRQGRLTQAQIAALARHLTTHRVIELLDLDAQGNFLLDLPAAAQEEARKADSLTIEYGGIKCGFLVGVRRATLRGSRPSSDFPELADVWSRFVALITIIDDLVEEDGGG
jgi:hypothetical protein